MNLFHQFHFGTSSSISSSSSISVFPNPLINNGNLSLTGCHLRLRRKGKTIEMGIRVRAAVPARDRAIDFGKYKGKMLGSLPSGYLKWVSKNLRARDFEEWAKLADQVLRDPIYRDRIEWEFAQNVLNGNRLNFNSKSLSAVSELMAISERFGWDNQDKVGWSKVDFDLLGTSNGGRIPRLVPPDAHARPNHKDRDFRSEVQSLSEEGGAEARTRSSRRMERRERQKTMRLKRRSEAEVEEQSSETQAQTQAGWWSGMKEKSRGSFVNEGMNMNMDMNVDDDDDDDDDGKDDAMGRTKNGIGNPFPGRQALLRNAMNRTIRF